MLEGKPSAILTATGQLGRVFASTAASYKFFWMLALLRLAPHSDRIAIRDLLVEMVVAAWPPGALYRLSFGPHDRLQNLVRDLQAEARLVPNTTETRVKTALRSWRGGATRLEALARYVPSRFLAPWHADGLPKSAQDEHRNRLLIERSQQRHGTVLAGPYAIFGPGLEAEVLMDPAWRAWLLENLGVVRGFTELELGRFLQARNPHVPGIVDKVRMPGLRKLAEARRAFERLRQSSSGLRDLYTGEPLGESYAVDHFLPRAFVAHDLIWNLAPTAEAVNRSKADQLPRIEFVRRLADLHCQLVQITPNSRADLDDYAGALTADALTLRRASGEEFRQRFENLFRPLMQIAASQGFRADWQPPLAGKLR